LQLVVVVAAVQVALQTRATCLRSQQYKWLQQRQGKLSRPQSSHYQAWIDLHEMIFTQQQQQQLKEQKQRKGPHMCCMLAENQASWKQLQQA
jgi:hypothetical protein